MNLEKEKGPRVSQHHMGWNAQRIFLLLPAAGEIFVLTFPFIERGNQFDSNAILDSRLASASAPVSTTADRVLEFKAITLNLAGAVKPFDCGLRRCR